MIFIKEEIYDHLVNNSVPENCGFLLGRDGRFYDIYEAENASKKKDKFKISFIERVVVLIKIFFNKYDDYILYHVHSLNKGPSTSDLIYSKENSYILIVCDHEANMFKVVKTKGRKRAIKFNYKVYL